MTQAPAGWYPDPVPPQPGQPPLLRYWDGRVWTEHVHPAAPPTAWPPYAGQEVAPGPTTPDGVPLSGWWRRVGAYVIDSLVVGGVTLVVTIRQQLQVQQDLNDLMRRFTDEAERSTAPDLGAFFRDYVDIALPLLRLTAIVSFLAWAVYSSLMLRFKGATVGKMAVGIAVRLRERPGQLPWSTILVRVVAQHGVVLTAAVTPILYQAFIWFPYLDPLWAAWDKKRQAIHDKVARTNVVMAR